LPLHVDWVYNKFEEWRVESGVVGVGLVSAQDN